MTIIIGIDPGSRVTGWGVVQRRGSRLTGVEAGILRLGDDGLENRLRRAFEGIASLIARFEPDAVAVEDIFFAKYPQAAIRLGHVRGVILLAAVQAGIPLAEYAPALVKRTVVGRGAADKAQVARLVSHVLGFAQPPPTDATDALAVAITHCSAARMQPAQEGRRRSYLA